VKRLGIAEFTVSACGSSASPGARPPPWPSEPTTRAVFSSRITESKSLNRSDSAQPDAAEAARQAESEPQGALCSSGWLHGIQLMVRHGAIVGCRDRGASGTPPLAACQRRAGRVPRFHDTRRGASLVNRRPCRIRNASSMDRAPRLFQSAPKLVASISPHRAIGPCQAGIPRACRASTSSSTRGSRPTPVV
jgi:hypothetical protein